MTRTIRSFVIRGGRMTDAQQRALTELWPRYGLETGGEALDLDAIFGRRATRTLEIGFGNGDHLAALAASHPERDYLGIEVHRPGVGRLLLSCHAQHSTNVRAICRDAVEVLGECLPPGSFDEVLLLFPDPWHKKRHHKRRMIQGPFLARLGRVLEPGAIVHVSTDDPGYAEWIAQSLETAEGFENMHAPERFSLRPPARRATAYEEEWAALGRTMAYFDYRWAP